MGHQRTCNCGQCCRKFESDLTKYDFAAVAVTAALAGVIWIVLAPLRIWHVTGADGRQHPDAATWIAYGVSGGIILAGLMFFSIRRREGKLR